MELYFKIYINQIINTDKAKSVLLSTGYLSDSKEETQNISSGLAHSLDKRY